MGILDRFKKPTSPEASGDSESATEEAAKPSEALDESAPKRGFFARLKQGLSKTTQLLRTDIRDLFKTEGRLVDDAFLEELRRDLIRTDIGPQAANQIAEEIGTQFRARVIHRHEAIAVIKENLKRLMAQEEAPLSAAISGPTVIMVCGVNGSGKT